MPEKTQQFAQNIAKSLIGEEAAHPAQPLIQMQGIRKSYYIGQPNELEILHGIDLTVYPGEFVAIVGEINSTPAIASSTILFTALLPAPPTPITMILAADSASFVIISNKGISSFAYASLFFYNIVICPNNQDNFKISY